MVFFVSDVWHRRLPTREGNPGRYFLQVHNGLLQVILFLIFELKMPGSVITVAGTLPSGLNLRQAVTNCRKKQLIGLELQE